jgi:Ca2+-binding RTX toxin-like protein
VGEDTIHLENAVFKALTATGVLSAAAFHVGAAAHDASDHIIYNAKTGALLYDADGNKAGAAIQFAILGAHLQLTNADFVVV